VAEGIEIVFEERERGFGDIRTNVGCNMSLSYSKPQTLLGDTFLRKMAVIKTENTNSGLVCIKYRVIHDEWTLLQDMIS